jgi:hypothetical protein
MKPTPSATNAEAIGLSSISWRLTSAQAFRRPGRWCRQCLAERSEISPELLKLLLQGQP